MSGGVVDDLDRARVERGRMALSDVGMDPDLIYIENGRPRAALDEDLAWRVAEVTKTGLPVCRRCFSAAVALWRRTRSAEAESDRLNACGSECLFTQDCGYRAAASEGTEPQP